MNSSPAIRVIEAARVPTKNTRRVVVTLHQETIGTSVHKEKKELEIFSKHKHQGLHFQERIQYKVAARILQAK